MVVRDPTSVRLAIETELLDARELLGVAEREYLETTAKFRFQEWIINSGVYDQIYSWLAPKKVEYIEEWQSKGAANFLSENWMWQFLENFQLYCYQTIFRLTLMQFWLTTVSPLMFAIVITGHQSWKIKQYQLSGQSTKKARFWLKSMWLTFITFLLYLITPNLVGEYTIYAPPVLLTLVALSIALFITSFSKDL